MRKYVIILATLILVACTVDTSGYVPSTPAPISKESFKRVKIPAVRSTLEPTPLITPSPQPTVKPTPRPTQKPSTNKGGWLIDHNISWYGPGFYGKRTACGHALTKTLLGVAHRTLKCGTLVTFMWKDIIITVPVVDRGPYVKGRQFDMTGGLCVALDHCFTGKIYYRMGK